MTSLKDIEEQIRKANVDYHSGVSIELARAMRGKVPEWNDSYIETFVPKFILEALANNHKWTDEEGFDWGYDRICATKIKGTQSNVVIVASKSLGMGHYELKLVTTSCVPQAIIKMFGHEVE